MEQSPPPHSPSEQSNPPAGNQGYASLPNQDYPPPSTDYPPQRQTGYPPQEYQGGYQNHSYPSKTLEYPPQWVGYKTPGHPPTGQGYPPQEGNIQQNSQNYNSITEVGQNQHQQPVGVMPIMNDRLGLAICSIFCCVPLGIVALLKSVKARSHYNAGNYQEAMATALTARNICYASICAGIGIYILIIILISVP